MLYINPLSSPMASQVSGPETQAGRQRIALQEFEHLFLNQLLKEMRKTVPENTMFPQSAQQRFFQETLDDVWAGEMARSEQFGIAKQMETQLQQAKTTSPELRDTNNVAGFPLHPVRNGISLSKEDQGIPIPKNEGIPIEFKKQEGIPLNRKTYNLDKKSAPVQDGQINTEAKPGTTNSFP